jgi:hypothetical protein
MRKEIGGEIGGQRPYFPDKKIGALSPYLRSKA